MDLVPVLSPGMVISFEKIGTKYLRKAPGLSTSTNRRRFRSLFGLSAEQCAGLWLLLMSELEPGATKHHMMWTLMFLKLYPTETVLQALCCAVEKTIRKWVRFFIYKIENLDIIKWSSRGIMPNTGVKVSVDCTDCRINEPKPFDKKWYSYKFNAAGLRYEIAVSLQFGNISWVNGPYPCGSYPDLKIFQSCLKKILPAEEKILTDKGYRDQKCVSPGQEEYYICVSDSSGFRARHEVLNGRLKLFFVLAHRFRHNLAFHSHCFHDVCVLVQLQLNYGEALFSIE